MEVRWGGADINRIRTFAKALTALQPEAGFSPEGSYVLIDCLPGLFCQFEPDWLTRFLLSGSGTFDCIGGPARHKGAFDPEETCAVLNCCCAKWTVRSYFAGRIFLM
jgi:hypothetical protein